jgi:glycosyltransferase involved in cell wall biosynthesis
VIRQRNLARFRDISRAVFSGRASASDQDEWFRANGPEIPELLEHLERHGREYDRVLFWSYRYFQTYFGLPLVADRAVLLPTAEEDPLIHAGVLERFFALPAGYLFLTPEEADLVAQRVTIRSPAAVIGCGVDPVPVRAAGAALGQTTVDRRLPAAARKLAGIADPFVLYLGRVDPNKGCESLLRNFSRYVDNRRGSQLVLAGPVNMPVPDHPAIRVLGFVADDVREALLARARVLMMPSPYESLSMVLLEAWNHGLPALVNARCAVLRGQVRRADGGLYYRTAGEFAAALDWLLNQPDKARTLGAQGLAHVEREYRWPIVMGKIQKLLQQIGT